MKYGCILMKNLPIESSQKSRKRFCETGYLVRYHCSACDRRWSAQWSCACDDPCPACGRDTEASDYELDGTHAQEELDAFNAPERVAVPHVQG